MTAPAQVQQTSELPSSPLRNEVAVVTGAARGIDRAVAVAFAREGAAVKVMHVCTAEVQVQIRHVVCHD
jgi:NAD(P)-dependent dehydrogenase (short-subunit alcohol dehydrogenase family)